MQDVLTQPRSLCSSLSNPFERSGLALALRFARNGSERLAGAFKAVPVAYRAPAMRLADRRPVVFVSCPCGGHPEAIHRPTPCPGECGRWYVGDESGVWAAKLPVDDDGLWVVEQRARKLPLR